MEPGVRAPSEVSDGVEPPGAPPAEVSGPGVAEAIGSVVVAGEGETRTVAPFRFGGTNGPCLGPAKSSIEVATIREKFPNRNTLPRKEHGERLENDEDMIKKMTLLKGAKSFSLGPC